MRYAPVRHAPVRYAPVSWYKPPEGSPEGVLFSEASSRAKRGRPAERSEAPPRLRRAKRGRAKVIGRSPLQKNSKRFHQKAQGNHLFRYFSILAALKGFFFFFLCFISRQNLNFPVTPEFFRNSNFFFIS